jgi:hypothetical protein
MCTRICVCLNFEKIKTLDFLIKQNFQKKTTETKAVTVSSHEKYIFHFQGAKNWGFFKQMTF